MNTICARWSEYLRQSNRPKYLLIPELIAEEVHRGTLEKGERLPTIKDVARDLHIALDTVNRAWRIAKERGLIMVYPNEQLGSFVAGPGNSSAVRLQPDVPKLTSAERQRRRREAARIGPPRPTPPDVPQLAWAANDPEWRPRVSAKPRAPRLRATASHHSAADELDDWPVQRRQVAANDAAPLSPAGPASVFDLAGRPVNVAMRHGAVRYRSIQRSEGVVRCRAITKHDTPEWIEYERALLSKRKPPRPTKAANAMKLKNSRTWGPCAA